MRPDVVPRVSGGSVRFSRCVAQQVSPCFGSFFGAGEWAAIEKPARSLRAGTEPVAAPSLLQAALLRRLAAIRPLSGSSAWSRAAAGLGTVFVQFWQTHVARSRRCSGTLSIGLPHLQYIALAFLIRLSLWHSQRDDYWPDKQVQ
jgi:hypothetical protein